MAARANGGASQMEDSRVPGPPDAKSHASGNAESSASGRRERTVQEQVESLAARGFEDLVSKPSFGRLLALSAENVAALTRIGSDAADLILRNLRVAGRADITRLARQLHRTEDKLERVLQEVEGLRDQLAADNTAAPKPRRGAVKRT